MEILLTKTQIIDLFFRFAAVGQLGLLFPFLIRKHARFPAAKVALIICAISYILLTAPIEDQHYGGLRHVLLLFTDLTCFAIGWFALTLLNEKFVLLDLPKWLLFTLSLWILVLVYFFLVMEGKGVLHDISHGVGIVVLVAVVYLCLAEFIDDLNNQRRNARLVLVAFCAVYMTVLGAFEFADRGIRNSWQFSLANAFVIFLLVSVVCIRRITSHRASTSVLENEQDNISVEEHAELSSLKQLMELGAFRQAELTIGKLAEQLCLPEHQLRKLINQQLGFNNFSHYLNSYRIPWVCEQLKDSSKKQLPILTLALEAGYGSIAPFNRAFKEQMGQTPKQFRDQF